MSCNCDYASTLTIKLASVAEQADADELLKLLWSGNVTAAKARAMELQQVDGPNLVPACRTSAYHLKLCLKTNVLCFLPVQLLYSVHFPEYLPGACP